MVDISTDDQSEIIRAFAQESRGLLEQLKPSIDELGKTENEQTLTFIYRFFHSIKGGASFMGLSNVTHVTHEVEILLEELRLGKIPLQVPKHTDLLYHACDFLSMAMDHLGKEPTDDDLEKEAEKMVSEFKKAANEPIKILKSSKKVKDDVNVRKTFIVGGGQGCFALFPILSTDKRIQIVGICDVNEKAPGVLLAREVGIPTTTNFQDFLKKNDVDFIIDVTGIPEVSQKLNSIKRNGVEVLGGQSARLVLELVKEREFRKSETEENLTEQEALNRIGLMLLSAKNIDIVFQRIVQCAIKLSKCKAGSLALYDEQSNEFRMVVAIGFSESFSKVQQWKLRKNGLTSHVLSNKQPTIIPDITKDSYCGNSVLLNEGIKSLMAVPLTLADKTIGILYVNDFVTHKFSPSLASLMVLLATQATFAIEKNRLLQKAEQMAITDELTRLYNHRYFVNALDSEINRARRFKQSLCFLMMDIDYFKHYNDTQGHETANIVLRTLARLLQDSVREIDVLARYGGEEFCVLLPGIDIEGGKILAERIRKTVESHPFPHGDEQPGGKLTISIGLACIPDHAEDGKNLVKNGDSALYKAKKAGRNVVIVYSPDN